MPWWAQNKGNFDRHLYIGHAAYRINNGGTDPNWSNPSEMPKQINLNRNVNGVNGSIFYNTTSFRRNLLGFNDSIQNNQYKLKAFVPLMPWIDADPPAQVTGLKIAKTNNGYILKWDQSPTNLGEMDKVKYYAVYRTQDINPNLIDDNAHLIAIVNHSESQYTDMNAPGEKYIYNVTAFDRLHNESLPVSVSTSTLSTTAETINAQVELFPPYPNPFSDIVSLKYHLKTPSKVKIYLYDNAGNWLADLSPPQSMIGWNEVSYNGSHLLSGIYFITIMSSDTKISKKVIKSSY